MNALLLYQPITHLVKRLTLRIFTALTNRYVKYSLVYFYGIVCNFNPSAIFDYRGGALVFTS